MQAARKWQRHSAVSVVVPRMAPPAGPLAIFSVTVALEFETRVPAESSTFSVTAQVDAGQHIGGFRCKRQLA